MLHLKLKKAVETHLSEGNNCRFESTMGPWGGSGSLRVDVTYSRNRRRYYVECETRPNIKRLRKKGEKRNKNYYRTMYNLIVPSSVFFKRDWRQLHGYFDNVYSYDESADLINDRVDLRTFGRLQDLILDRAMPFFRSPEYEGFARFFWIRKNRVKRYLENQITCLRCCMGKGRPIYYCRYNTCQTYKLFQGKKEPPELVLIAPSKVPRFFNHGFSRYKRAG